MCIKTGKELGIHGLMNLDATLEEVANALKAHPNVGIYYGRSSVREGHKVLDIRDGDEGLVYISIYDDGVIYCGATDDGVS